VSTSSTPVPSPTTHIHLYRRFWPVTVIFDVNTNPNRSSEDRVSLSVIGTPTDDLHTSVRLCRLVLWKCLGIRLAVLPEQRRTSPASSPLPVLEIFEVCQSVWIR
jgi:hypothetical protein